VISARAYVEASPPPALHQPLAAVEAGNKAGGLIAVGPGGLQVRAGRTDFEDAAEGGMANPDFSSR
jgi:hypothetical protein